MIWTAFTAELRREITQLRRYPTEFLSEAIFIAVVFYGLFLGGSYMAGHGILGSRLSDIIIGYTLWTLMLGAIGNMGWGIANEAQNGTLEQVCLAPMRIRTIFALRALANLVYDLALTLVALVLIMLVTHHTIHFSALELEPVVLAIGVSIGIGYLVASVTILFKRSSQFLNLLQFAVLFLVMTPLRPAWRLQVRRGDRAARTADGRPTTPRAGSDALPRRGGLAPARDRQRDPLDRPRLRRLRPRA